MRLFLSCILSLAFLTSCNKGDGYDGEIFDTHLHFAHDVQRQFSDFRKYNVTTGAVSSSWNNMDVYRNSADAKFLVGLMFPCPNGIVPYSGQKCFSDGSEYPELDWVRSQIVAGNIDFFGEVLNEYCGISPSDSTLYPYYALAHEYKLPVGIHTGLAGPDHLCPNYNAVMGDPALMKSLLEKFPGLKVWIMHAGAPYLKGTIDIMTAYPHVYTDISVLANPEIVKENDFHSYMKALIDAGLEDRVMFGSDNGDVGKMIEAVDGLRFLNDTQKQKIFRLNAQRFFSKE